MPPQAASTSSGRVYLDANATTRPFPEVVEVVAQHLRQSYANPGSRHAEGRQARRVLETARERMADLLDADPGEVIFTSGGTESSNLALFGMTQGSPGTILLTAGEHPATMESCRSLVQRGWQLSMLDVHSSGLLRADQLATLPWERIKLATVILAHNETGVVQDTRPLAAQCRLASVPLHIDAVQAVGKIPVRFHELGSASLSLGAHKFHGPRGVGALLLRDDIRLAPRIFGGHQESDRRPGTEPVALIAGMVRALELCCEEMTQRTQKLVQLRDSLERGLCETCEPVVINGSREHRLPHTLNISFPGVDGEAMLVALDLEGIACSLGSTCASGSAEPAPALVAMGAAEDVYKSAVRFTVSTDNTLDEMTDAVQRIARVVSRLRSLRGTC